MGKSYQFLIFLLFSCSIFDIFGEKYSRTNLEVFVQDQSTFILHKAKIQPASQKDMPAKKLRWKFNWKALYEEEAFFFKLVFLDETQALLKVRIQNEELVCMENVEVAPHNYGKGGQFGRIAESMIAYACRFSFIYGKGEYTGYLIFESKTALIPYYENHYQAEVIFGNRMFIAPENGKKLVKEFLQIIV